MKQLLILSALAIGALTLSGCETISEDECLAGGWESIGFRDGENGASRAKLADYNKSCLQYNVTPDRTAYMTGYDKGLLRYCNYDRGFDIGRAGNSANEECRVVKRGEYFDGYEDGREIYVIDKEHDRMIAAYRDRQDALVGTLNNLKAEGLSDDEIRRLNKKADRIERELEDMRVDIRVFERENGLSEFQG